MGTYSKLFADCKEYLSTRYDLLRLELLEKLSIIIGMLVFLIVTLFLGFGAIAYFSVALVHLMANVMAPAVACIILGGVLIVILLLLYWQREKLFVNPLVKKLSQILFAPKEQEVSDLNLANKEEKEAEHGETI
ncbi:MAG: phage holin family protein [Paludibacteraceae bacterium]|nr:phage holin family protein [Paludibacteraceae bacterium]